MEAKDGSIGKWCGGIVCHFSTFIAFPFLLTKGGHRRPRKMKVHSYFQLNLTELTLESCKIRIEFLA